jgi:hypothetical protein
MHIAQCIPPLHTACKAFQVRVKHSGEIFNKYLDFTGAFNGAFKGIVSGDEYVTYF